MLGDGGRRGGAGGEGGADRVRGTTAHREIAAGRRPRPPDRRRCRSRAPGWAMGSGTSSTCSTPTWWSSAASTRSSTRICIEPMERPPGRWCSGPRQGAHRPWLLGVDASLLGAAEMALSPVIADPAGVRAVTRPSPGPGRHDCSGGGEDPVQHFHVSDRRSVPPAPGCPPESTGRRAHWIPYWLAEGSRGSRSTDQRAGRRRRSGSPGGAVVGDVEGDLHHQAAFGAFDRHPLVGLGLGRDGEHRVAPSSRGSPTWHRCRAGSRMNASTSVGSDEQEPGHVHGVAADVVEGASPAAAMLRMFPGSGCGR